MSRDQIGASGMFLLSTFLLLDYAFSVALRHAGVPASRVIVAGVPYLLFATWAVLSGIRIAAGRGIAGGSILLVCLAMFIGLLAATASQGNYDPPLVVWVFHALVVLSLLYATVCLVARAKDSRR